MKTGRYCLDDNYLRFNIREAVETQNPQHMRDTFPSLPDDAVEFILQGGAWEINDGGLIIA